MINLNLLKRLKAKRAGINNPQKKKDYLGDISAILQGYTLINTCDEDADEETAKECAEEQKQYNDIVAGLGIAQQLTD